MTALASDVARFARERGDGRFVVFADAAAAPLARRIVRQPGALGSATLDVRGAGFEPIDRAIATLQRRRATRSSVIVAVGAGPLLDAVRIAAALYEGGTECVLVATTLGSAIERGVDAVARRGALAVTRPVAELFVDYDALPNAARDGLGTLVRDAVIEGDEFFDGMETLAPHPLAKWPWESVVDDALRVDRMHNGDDRRVLDLGRPFAAAIAAVHPIPPQVALVLGLRAACLTARRIVRFGERDHLRVLAVLALLGFSLHDRRIDARAVLDAIPGEARFALPHAIGDVESGVAVPRPTLRKAIARLTAPPGASEFR